MNNIENEKIISPLKLMTKSEVVNDLLKLLDMVQKHADKEGCQHCLDLLESVFALKYDFRLDGVSWLNMSAVF